MSGQKVKPPTRSKARCAYCVTDKYKLSSFGTKEGYPIIMRCGNLLVKIQNEKGLGGGHVVSWLPVVCLKFIATPLPYLMIPLRLRKMHLSLARLIMSTSNKSCGMNHFESCSNQFTKSPKADITLIVLMTLIVSYTQLSLYFLQTMKSNTSIFFTLKFDLTI